MRDSLHLILLVFTAIPYLAYIPAAFGLSLARKGSEFDCCSGEMAYLACQAFLALCEYSPSHGEQ